MLSRQPLKSRLWVLVHWSFFGKIGSSGASLDRKEDLRANLSNKDKKQR
jgi:hypothetical protein